MKRELSVFLSSPNNDISPDELKRLTNSLNSMEDWQLTGEREEDVQDFFINAQYNTEL